MADKPTYEELEQRIKELEQEASMAISFMAASKHMSKVV